MRINITDRTDKSYPEPPECEVNGRNCVFSVDNVCHECGKQMCHECSVGVRHQPYFSKYTYETTDGTERIQQHCPGCLENHTINMRNLAIGIGGLLVGLLLIAFGTTQTPALAIGGVLLALVGLLVTRYEFRLKARQNDDYGVSDMF